MSAAIVVRDRDLRLALRADPRWLSAALVLVGVLCLGGFVLLFHLLGVRGRTVWTGLVPGVTMATFAGAALAWLGRRRGGTAFLAARGDELALEDGKEPRRVLGAGPFGALLLKASDGPTRALVLTQGLEQTVVLALDEGFEPDAAWAARTVTLRMAPVPLSSATAGVLTTVRGQSLHGLLSYLEARSLADAPLLYWRLENGKHLELRYGADGKRPELRVGEVELHGDEEVAARRITIDTAQGPVLGLSLIGSVASLLLASEDPAGPDEGGPIADAPDAFLSPAVFAAVCTLYGVDPGVQAALTREYKP